MRRWSGWGEETQEYALSENGLAFLQKRLGKAPNQPVPDFLAAVERVGESRLLHFASQFSCVKTDNATRLLHSHGQSYPDWLATHQGRTGPYPDAVAMPQSHEEAADVFQAAYQAGYVIIPFGGGTNLSGQLAVSTPDQPVLVISLARMQRLLEFEPSARLARLQAGATGPFIEAQLRQKGYTLGHYPQSFEYSTLGGWIATRASGQQDLYYGQIESWFAGARACTPNGELNIPATAFASAGMDLRAMLLGSEGRAGLITEVDVRVMPIPEHESFHAIFFPNWDFGLNAVREMTQARLASVSMLRLLNSSETQTHLALSASPRSVTWLQRYLNIHSIQNDGQCLLMLGLTDSEKRCKATIAEALDIVRDYGGVYVGRKMGQGWQHGRFQNAYLRNTLWSAGYGLDTLEIATPWPMVTRLMQRIEQAGVAAGDEIGEKIHVFSHLSQVNAHGAALNSSFIFRTTSDYGMNLSRWLKLKVALHRSLQQLYLPMAHQQGVGRDQKPWLRQEKTPEGLLHLRAMLQSIDPHQLLNPHKLVD